MAMKRDALLDCLDTARDCYRHAWARTSVDIAIQVPLALALCDRSYADTLDMSWQHACLSCHIFRCVQGSA